MQQIQPPSAPSGGKINARVVIIVLVVLLIGAAIAILMQQCSTGGLGGSGTGNNPTAKGTDNANAQSVKVTIKENSCAINDGTFTDCAEVCEQIKNRTDKTGLVVLVNGRDGLVEKIKELKECLSAAGINHAKAND